MNDSDPPVQEPTGSDSGGRPSAVDEASVTEVVSSIQPRPLPEVGERTLANIGASAFPELTDRTIGDFRILRRLGIGGMAEVYLAEQVSLNRKVALKVLRKEVLSGSDDVLLERFDREARAAAALTHQNIVQVHGVGEEDGLHWIAQEYVHGVNLKQYLGRKGPPDAGLAVRFAKQVALALRAAGEAGIVHRDVKPENVMVTPKGKVKVADFGLAQLNRDENVHLTQVGTTMGTPLYMSPEQVNGKPTDGRSDLYAFGVTLYHLLAGEPPFQGETALAIAVKHLNEPAPRLHERRADLPRSLCDLVHRLMEKDPARRPVDADEVYEELKRIGKAIEDGVQGREVAPRDRPAGETAEWSARVDRRRTYRQIGVAVAVLLLVGTVSAGIGWLTRPGNPLDTPPAAPGVRRQDDVEDQMWVALRMQTEESWQAVVDHFGTDPNPRTQRSVSRARIRLGLYAMSDRRFDEARSRFEVVYTEQESDPALRANAVAGLAALASLTGDYRESQRLIVEELQDQVDELDDELRRLVESTIRRNREQLGNGVPYDLESLFDGTTTFE